MGLTYQLREKVSPHPLNGTVSLGDEIIPIVLRFYTVIARSTATKQSIWIATARYAHLAMTKG